MPITNDQLFQEDFKPQWLITKEQAIKESLENAVTVEVEYKWRLLAQETVKRISAKHQPLRQSYSKTSR